MKTSLLKPILVKYSTLSAAAISLTGSAIAIERPQPAEQPTEKKEVPAQKAANPAQMQQMDMENDAEKMLTYLGVYGAPVSENLAHHLKIEPGVGISLELIAPKSPASKAAFKKRDIILTIAGQDITSMADIRKVVTAKKAGDEVEVQLISEGNKITKNVTLSERLMPKAVGEVQPQLQPRMGGFPNQEMRQMGLPKELLEQFPKADRVRLQQLLEGGAFENRFKDLEKQFDELNELIPDMPEANQRMNFQGNFHSRVKMLDQHGSITLESTNDGQVLELKEEESTT